MCVCVCVCVCKISFNQGNTEQGIIPIRTNKIFKNRILNFNIPSKELNLNKFHRANIFKKKKKINKKKDNKIMRPIFVSWGKNIHI